MSNQKKLSRSYAKAEELLSLQFPGCPGHTVELHYRVVPFPGNAHRSLFKVKAIDYDCNGLSAQAVAAKLADEKVNTCAQVVNELRLVLSNDLPKTSADPFTKRAAYHYGAQGNMLPQAFSRSSTDWKNLRNERRVKIAKAAPPVTLGTLLREAADQHLQLLTYLSMYNGQPHTSDERKAYWGEISADHPTPALDFTNSARLRRHALWNETHYRDGFVNPSFKPWQKKLLRLHGQSRWTDAFGDLITEAKFRRLTGISTDIDPTGAAYRFFQALQASNRGVRNRCGRELIHFARAQTLSQSHRVQAIMLLAGLQADHEGFSQHTVKALPVDLIPLPEIKGCAILWRSSEDSEDDRKTDKKRERFYARFYSGLTASAKLEDAQVSPPLAISKTASCHWLSYALNNATPTLMNSLDEKMTTDNSNISPFVTRTESPVGAGPAYHLLERQLEISDTALRRLQVRAERLNGLTAEKAEKRITQRRKKAAAKQRHRAFIAYHSTPATQEETV
jgi:hypothetical protein